MRTLLLPAALLPALLLGGCTGTVLKSMQPEVHYVELPRVPFFPQKEYQCGPASLAMVLVASGVDVSPDALVEQVYVPERKGSFQAEIIAATRRHGRVPYLLQPDPKALLAEVADGNPVLVFQNLSFDVLPVWHYAVAIGYDTQSEKIFLHSGEQRRKEVRVPSFLRSWDAAGRWAMVAMRPDRIPATATLEDWLKAVSAFEELGQPEIAEGAYRAATRRWPNQALPWIALGNALHAQGAVPAAERAFWQAVRRDAGAAARNNLAHVLLARGCPLQALAQVDAALRQEGPPEVKDALRRTRTQILEFQGTPAADCAR